MRPVIEYLRKVASLPTLIGGASGAYHAPEGKRMEGAVRGAVGAGGGAHLGRAAGEVAGKGIAAALSGSLLASGDISPKGAKALFEGLDSALGAILGTGGAVVGATKGYEAMSIPKSAARGFIEAFLESEMSSEPMEKVAWTGIPRQAQGKLDAEITRVMNLTDRYPGGMFEGGYTFDEMMNVLGNSDRVANQSAAQQLRGTHTTRSRR